MQNEVEVKIGETALFFMKQHNPTEDVISGQASFNVFPFSAGNYFSKIDCFVLLNKLCNQERKLKMPVTFYIDPEIIENIETKNIKIADIILYFL